MVTPRRVRRTATAVAFLLAFLLNVALDQAADLPWWGLCLIDTALSLVVQEALSRSYRRRAALTFRRELDRW